jgi:hypothetical protein
MGGYGQYQAPESGLYSPAESIQNCKYASC